ncbi:TetR/AcrR family transcriptional regulator [Nocardioides albidus]|uniref:TetR/AcrR family transcriptional regulator n=1 Tax=Nocardioides albidus TaxID=1517589 RepID=UPI0019620534|nr:TetR family transcriptional regulator [Nocardioides albidus]
MGKVKRAYRSDLRARQAHETRRRVVAAAARLFTESGYAGTTLAKIAAEAGVSPETVQSHGPKAALLRAAIELAGFGVEGVDDSAQLDQWQVALAAEEDELPEVCGRILARTHAAMAGLIEALVGGAGSDPELRDYYADMVAGMRTHWRRMFDLLDSRGWLRDDQPLKQAAEGWSAIASPETHVRLVRDFGWSDRRYAAWIATMMRTTVLRER